METIDVFFTNGPNPARDSEAAFVADLIKEVESAESRYRIVATPDAADLVVLIESVNVKTPEDRSRLENSNLVRDHYDKCLTINYEDTPPGFFPGLYMSLPASRFNSNFHRSWSCIFGDGYQKVQEAASAMVAVQPHYLFSFRGAPSHPVRRTLFEQNFSSGFPFVVTGMDRWLNYSDGEKVAYVEEILASHFVLCPRGIGCGTHRMFEVMSLARCPVVISDEWVASKNVPWDRFTIRVQESEIHRIPAILEERLPLAAEMGAEAKKYWEEHFSLGRRAVAALDQLCEIQNSRLKEPDTPKRWRSHAFVSSNGWRLDQRTSSSLRKILRQAKQAVRQIGAKNET